jgi:hypothetical protein
MSADLIIYISICLLSAAFIRRVGEVFGAYEAQPVDSAPKTEWR